MHLDPIRDNPPLDREDAVEIWSRLVDDGFEVTLEAAEQEIDNPSEGDGPRYLKVKRFKLQVTAKNSAALRRCADLADQHGVTASASFGFGKVEIR